MDIYGNVRTGNASASVGNMPRERETVPSMIESLAQQVYRAHSASERLRGICDRLDGGVPTPVSDSSKNPAPFSIMTGLQQQRDALAGILLQTEEHLSRIEHILAVPVQAQAQRVG